MKLVLTVGIPGSGKSYWARQQVEKSGGNVKRINKDELRALFDNGKWSKRNEKFVVSSERALVESMLKSGFSVIVDNTHFNTDHQDFYKELAKKYDATFQVKDFTDVPLETCIKRDLERPNSVGSAVIMEMYNRYLKPPVEPYIAPEDSQEALLCDLDGTLASMAEGGRSPYDWMRVGEDTLNEPVADIVNKYWSGVDSGVKIILMSGRDSVCRGKTQDWLHLNGIRYHELHMRREGDKRSDEIVKRELFDEHIRGKYKVLFVLDDRTRVVRVWRDLGLICFQVADGNF